MNYKEGLREQLGEEINIKICLNSGQFQEIGNIQLQGNFNIVLQFLQVQGSRYGTQVGTRYKILGRYLGRNQVHDSRQELRQELGTRFQVGTQVGTRIRFQVGTQVGTRIRFQVGTQVGARYKILGRYLGRNSSTVDARKVLGQELGTSSQVGTWVLSTALIKGLLGTTYSILQLLASK